MAKREEEYFSKDEIISMIIRSRLPVLTLDRKWIGVFSNEEKSAKIKALEDKVNKSLKSQGSINSKRDDLISLSNLNTEGLKNLVDRRIKEIEPKDNESVGIQAILSQNFASCNLARYASKFVQEKENLEIEMRSNFIKSCPLFLKRLKSNSEQNERS